MKGVTRGSVTEVKSLANPPEGVKITLRATFLLLGHFEEETKDYRVIKRLLGDIKSLFASMNALKAEDVPLNVALGAQILAKDFTTEAVMKISRAAADFVQWNTEVIQAVLSRYSEEEISKTEPRTKLYNEPDEPLPQ